MKNTGKLHTKKTNLRMKPMFKKLQHLKKILNVKKIF